MRNPQNIIKHEFIGLQVEVSESENSSLVDISGRVVGETKKTLEIQTLDGVKSVLKEQSVFKFRLPSGEEVEVEGGLIAYRPEERIKKASFPRKRV